MTLFLYDFGIRSVPPCGDCDEDGHCTMNCSPGRLDGGLNVIPQRVAGEVPDRDRPGTPGAGPMNTAG